MRMFASAVILSFLIGAPALAHPYQQQEDKTKQDERARQQDEQARRQQEQQAQEEEKARSREQQQQNRAAEKQQEEQQKQMARQQEQQQKEAARQEKERAKQEQQQAKQDARARQQQQRTYTRQQNEEERRHGGSPVQNRAPNRHAFATAQTYHADDVHPRHGGRVIRDRDYDERFGEDHHFRVHWRHDADRFQYSGYWFTYEQPWPDDWGDDDDYYIVYDEDDDDYYLCDMEHPEFELLIIVES